MGNFLMNLAQNRNLKMDLKKTKTKLISSQVRTDSLEFMGIAACDANSEASSQLK